MKTTIREKIENKIFKKEDIKRVFDLINEEYIKSQNKDSHSILTLEVSCIDGTSYESEADDLLCDGDIIDLKTSNGITIDYHDYSQNRKVVFSLAQGEFSFGSVIIEGEKEWTSKIFSSLKDIINAVKPQSSWFSKYSGIFLIIGSIVIIILILLILFYLLSFTGVTDEMVLGFFSFSNPMFPLFFVILATFAIFSMYLLFNWVNRLWPSIEFDFGPEHNKREKSLRRILYVIFSIILIPILLYILF